MQTARMKGFVRDIAPSAAWDTLVSARALVAKALRSRAKPTTADHWENQRHAANQHLFDHVFGHIWAGMRGDYYEFGICGAGQFRMAMAMASKWGLSDTNFYAFDSFKGLPLTGHLAMSEASFWKSIRDTGLDCSRVRTTSGFYEDSLTPALQAELLSVGRPAMFVNVDCDLHESAQHVFSFIEPLIRPGSVVYVDDFYTTFFSEQDRSHGSTWGTAQAFFDFQARSRLKFYPFIDAGYWGKAFIAYDPKQVEITGRP